MFSACKYNPLYKGLYQGTCRIVKNTELNHKIDHMTLMFLQKLGTNGIIERLDQTIYSFIVNNFFSNIKVFPFSQQVFQSKYMTWMYHNTSTPIPFSRDNYMNAGYVFGKLSNLYLLK